MRKGIRMLGAVELFTTGRDLSAKQQYPKAIEAFTRAIELKPDFYDAYVCRGIAYIESGDATRALADLTTAVQGMPKNFQIYYNRSIAYMELNDSDSALADMDQAIRLAPKDSNNFNYRCFIHSSRKEYDAAIQDATEAIALGAGKSGYNNRAIALEKKGDYPAALEDWNKVLELQPGNAAALCFRGRVYGEIGEKGKAISDLRQGLKDSSKLGQKLKMESDVLLQKLEAG
jgi:tetratricopeptide (TPR) repeat protein